MEASFEVRVNGRYIGRFQRDGAAAQGIGRQDDDNDNDGPIATFLP